MIFNKTRLSKVFLVSGIVFVFGNAHANPNDTLESISKSIMAICDKPENAGKYLNRTFKADSNARVGIKIAGGKTKGSLEFTETEWTNVVKTIEDTKSYRECVKVLYPLMLEKLTYLPTEPVVLKRLVSGADVESQQKYYCGTPSSST